MARPATVSPERILAAAAAEFAAHGYAGARVDRIARRARVNKAMLYYHFRNKRTLYRELLRAVFRQAADRLRTVAASDLDAAGALDQAIQTISDLAREESHFPAVMLREIAEGGAHLDRETLAALSAVPRAFAELLARGERAGSLRPVHPFAAYITMMAPIIFFMASAPIRRELEVAHLLATALPPADFIDHMQFTMRQALLGAGGVPRAKTGRAR
jgi:AcrR family transcriptional regulator